MPATETKTPEKKAAGWDKNPWTKTAKDRKFTKVEAPDFHTFSPGESIEGMILRRESKKFRNSMGMLYTIQVDEAGTEKRFHGSTILDDLMANVPDNAFVRITRNEKDGKTDGGQPLHGYDVEVAAS